MSRMSWASLGRTLLGRLGGMLAVLSLVSVLVFLLTRLAAGDPIAVLLGDQASLEDIAQARQRYGLDQPLTSQFILWLGEVLKGNLGQSIFLQMPVTQVLLDRVEPTAWLAFFVGQFGHADRRAVRHCFCCVARALDRSMREHPGHVGREHAQFLDGTDGHSVAGGRRRLVSGVRVW